MKYLLAVAVAMLGSGGAQSAAVVPHRAIYDLTLLKSSDSSGLASADGRMAIEFSGSSCEGWTVSFRMVNKYQPVEGPGKLVDTQSTTYESGGFLDYHYSQKDFIDNRPESEDRMKVTRPSLEAEGKGEITEPLKKDLTIPAGTLFPMQHQLRLMDSAAKGELRDASVVFDGSDGDKLFRVITLIAAPKAPGANTSDAANSVAAPLAGQRSWHMMLSYYQAAGQEAVPTYQSNFDIYENGVATNLELDYGDFTLGGKLAKLDLLPAEACQ